jgi:hemerythrin-like domain-containing protein
MNDMPERLRRLDEELLFLLRQYPRETWQTHANLGDLARLWLQRHDMFRKLDRMIREGAEAAFDEKMEAREFKPWLARYLQFYLGQLEGHHQVEDHHYFPVFRRAEPRLGRGFDILDADHDSLHTAIESIAGQANALLRQPDTDAAALRTGLGRFRDIHVAMGRGLIQHLDDEEDLVVPLILDRGEGGLAG